MDGSGIDSDGDILIEFSHVKYTNTADKLAVSDFPSAVYYYDFGLKYIGPAGVEVAGNTITLTVDRNSHSSLTGLNATKAVRFTAQGNLSGVFYRDSYPNDFTYAPLSPNSTFTDNSGDVNVVGADVDLFDLGQLQVSFD